MTTPPDKPDFSNVKGSVASTEAPRADFSNVQSSVVSTEATAGGGSGSAGAQTYTVVKGDTLSHIAKHFYGKAGQWHAIFEANRGLLDDPDKIYPGQVLTIPAQRD